MKSSKLFRTPEKIRNKPQGEDVKEIKRIAVIGAGPDVGVSFLSGLLASYVCNDRASEENVSLIELGTPYFYEAFGIQKRFFHREFLSFYDILAGRGSIKGLANMEEEINWVLRCPPSQTGGDGIVSPDVKSDAKLSCSLRLVHNTQGSLLIFDCSGVSEEMLWELLPEMDGVVLVIDPMPSRLLPAGSRIERLRLTMNRTVFVVNKMNKGVHKGEVCRFLGTKDFCTMPFVNAENLYKAEFNCVLPYMLPAVRKETEAPLKSLWEAILQGMSS